jgi:hypothetical protein
MPAHRIVSARALVALAILILSCVASQAQTMKPGLWEVRHQAQLDPQQQAQMDEARKEMAAMPPDQRKMMESMMAQRGMSADMAGGGMMVKVCVTKEQAERDAPPVDDRTDCKHDVKRDGKVIHTRFECSKPPSQGEGDITMTSPEAYSMKMRVTSQRDGKAQTMAMSGEGRWLGSECGAIKPRIATR